MCLLPQVKSLSITIYVYPYKTEAGEVWRACTGVCTHTRRQCDCRGREQSDVTTHQGMLAATRCRQRQGTDSSLQWGGGAALQVPQVQPSETDLRLLVSRPDIKQISVVLSTGVTKFVVICYSSHRSWLQSCKIVFSTESRSKAHAPCRHSPRLILN